MSNIVERLRGTYRISITDGFGPILSSEESDNPNEFVRTFKSPPIQHEAAAEIERLRAERQRTAALIEEVKKLLGRALACNPPLHAAVPADEARALLSKLKGEAE